MNNKLKTIPIEKMLFWDIETIRETNELDPSSEAFHLFRQKNRNRDTDEYLSDSEVLDLYKRKAALSPTHNKIVCISMGVVIKGVLYIRSIVGDQAGIIEEFGKILQKDYIPCGYNIVQFDFPVLRLKAFKEGILDCIPEKFNDANKKPWALTEIKFETVMVDLMEYVKGTYYYNLSLAEACFLAGIESPKNGEVEGAGVSEEYYKNGVEKIRQYCERDILSCVHLTQKMQGVELITDVVYKEPIVTVRKEAVLDSDSPLFDAILKVGKLTAPLKKKVTEASKGLTDGEKVNLVLLVKSALQRKDEELSADEVKFLNGL